jgi:hypothetical protein
MGGEIGLVTALGVGSTFTLPLAGVAISVGRPDVSR